MKRLITFTTAIIYLSTVSVFAQQYGWTDLFGNMPNTPTDTIYIEDEPYYNSFTDIFFVNDNVGWVTSLQQNEEQEFLIFHTQDGGQTWDLQSTWWDYSHAIWMLDTENGYLGDHNGFIFVTHDGGDTWNFHGATGGPVTDISFAPGSDTGYVTIDESHYLWQITPQGVNQINIDHLNYWSGISAIGDKIWFCGGIQVFYWDIAQQSIFPEFVVHCGYFGPVLFVDSGHGWIGNLCEIRGFVNYDYYWPEILSTEEDAITCLYAIDTNQLWATTFAGHIYHTTNAWDYGYIKETNEYWSNVEWETQEHPKTGELLSAIQFTSPTCGYACGENNTVLKYTLTAGIDENNESDISIFPNPVLGKFQIAADNTKSKLQSVELFDLNGRVMKRWNISPATFPEFDISSFPAGVYFLRIKSSSSMLFCKVIKQ